ncbi:MAG: MvdC/MvdD family ATP grasp protein [Chitinophagaceae bacterium]
MNKKKVLIITHTKDNNSVDAVINFIKESGSEVIRFDVDRYPLEISLTTLYDGGAWKVLFDDGKISTDLADVTAIWYRRSYNLGDGLHNILEAEYVIPAMGELKRTLYGMLDGLFCFQMERFSVYRRLDSKEEQLRMAMRHGLKVPATCISNDPVEVKRFIRSQEKVVSKMQSSFSIYREKEEHVVFTSEINEDHLEDMDTLKYCPMVFQEKIEKKLELRVTIVGNKIFSFSIDSQRVVNAKVDWRKEGVALLEEWQPYELPMTVQKKLLAFMDDYKLNYGAIDLILTPDDEYYFLEINAAGEYFWLDRLCNNLISKQIAAVLCGDAARREAN